MEENLETKNIDLYRYMTVDRFLMNLSTDSDMYVEPFVWANYDVFEDLLSKLESKNNNSFSITKDIFAQCWNSGEECDGMWKNYTNSKLDNGVMIVSDKITIENNLKELLKNSGLKFPYKIEKVEYLSSKDIITECQNYFDDLDNLVSGRQNKLDDSLIDSDGEKILKQLSLKRKEYSYEKEYRVFIQRHKHFDGIVNFDSQKILVKGFRKRIKKVIFSPNMSQDRYEYLKKCLINNYYFSPNCISKSSLYNIEELIKNTRLKLKKIQ